MNFSLLSIIFATFTVLAAAAPVADADADAAPVADAAPFANAVAASDSSNGDREYFLFGVTFDLFDADKYKVTQCGGSGEQLCACADGTCGQGVHFWITPGGVIYTKWAGQETPHVYLTWDNELHLVLRENIDTSLNPLSVSNDGRGLLLHVNGKDHDLWICKGTADDYMHLTLFTSAGNTDGCKRLYWQFDS